MSALTTARRIDGTLPPVEIDTRTLLTPLPEVSELDGTDWEAFFKSLKEADAEDEQ